jgi:hypothetical protein
MYGVAGALQRRKRKPRIKVEGRQGKEIPDSSVSNLRTSSLPPSSPYLNFERGNGIQQKRPCRNPGPLALLCELVLTPVGKHELMPGLC